MVLDNSRRGLIVTPARRTNDLIEELIAQLDWPVLFQPSVRLLLQQVEVTAPHCLLFWLDETHELDHTLRLIARLRDRGPRPYRIAVAHGVATSVEPAIRAAGIHTYLCTAGNIAALVENGLAPLVESQTSPANGKTAHPHAKPLIRGPTQARASPAEIQPP